MNGTDANLGAMDSTATTTTTNTTATRPRPRPTPARRPPTECNFRRLSSWRRPSGRPGGLFFCAVRAPASDEPCRATRRARRRRFWIAGDAAVKHRAGVSAREGWSYDHRMKIGWHRGRRGRGLARRAAGGAGAALSRPSPISGPARSTAAIPLVGLPIPGATAGRISRASALEPARRAQRRRAAMPVLDLSAGGAQL